MDSPLCSFCAASISRTADKYLYCGTAVPPQKSGTAISRVFEIVRQFSEFAHMKNLHLHTELVPRRICKPPAETVALADADRHGARLLRLRRRSRCARFLRAQFYTLDYTVIPARNARNFAKKITQINKFFCFLCVSFCLLHIFFDFFMIFRFPVHHFLQFRSYYLRQPRDSLSQIRQPQQQMHKFHPFFRVRLYRLLFFRANLLFFPEKNRSRRQPLPVRGFFISLGENAAHPAPRTAQYLPR